MPRPNIPTALTNVVPVSRLRRRGSASPRDQAARRTTRGPASRAAAAAEPTHTGGPRRGVADLDADLGGGLPVRRPDDVRTGIFAPSTVRSTTTVTSTSSNRTSARALSMGVQRPVLVDRAGEAGHDEGGEREGFAGLARCSRMARRASVMSSSSSACIVWRRAAGPASRRSGAGRATGTTGSQTWRSSTSRDRPAAAPSSLRRGSRPG